MEAQTIRVSNQLLKGITNHSNMINSKRVSRVFTALNNPNTFGVLTYLAKEQKHYTFFREIYGNKISWTLSQLLNYQIINKKLDIAQMPVGYVITDYGRWLFNSWINFKKLFEIDLDSLEENMN